MKRCRESKITFYGDYNHSRFDVYLEAGESTSGCNVYFSHNIANKSEKTVSHSVHQAQKVESVVISQPQSISNIRLSSLNNNDNQQNEDNLSYAEILRKVKADPKLSELEETVAKIRRTQKGELLLQLKDTGQKTELIKRAMSETLGEQADVKSLKHRVTMIKDIDEVTTKREICYAILAQFGELDIFGKRYT